MEDLDVGIIKICHRCGQGIVSDGVCSVCGKSDIGLDCALLKDSLEKTPIEDYKDCKMCGYLQKRNIEPKDSLGCIKYHTRYIAPDKNPACPDYRKRFAPLEDQC